MTDTLSSATRTGIQRVVVALAWELFQREHAVLVRFDRWSGGFVPLNDAERAQLFLASHPAPRRRWQWPLVRLWKVPVMALMRRGARFFSQGTPQADLKSGVYITAEILGDPLRHRAVTNLTRDGVPTVFILHDLFPLTHPEWTSLTASDFRRHWAAVCDARLVAAISNHTRSEAESLLASAARRPEVFVLHPGHSLGSVVEIEPPAWNPAPYFLCVGTVEPRKNQLGLLEAFADYWRRGGRRRLVFVGRPGSEAGTFAARLEALSAATHSVSWLTKVTDGELQWLYRRAEATLYPSWAEGFGLPIVESLAAGTPCLTATTTSTGEVANLHGGCVRLDPSQASSWAGAMLEFDQPAHRAGLAGQISQTNLPTWSAFCDGLGQRISLLRSEGPQ